METAESHGLKRKWGCVLLFGDHGRRRKFGDHALLCRQDEEERRWAAFGTRGAGACSKEAAEGPPELQTGARPRQANDLARFPTEGKGKCGGEGQMRVCSRSLPAPTLE